MAGAARAGKPGDAVKLTGVDLLSGVENPEVGSRLASAVAAADYAGKYVVVKQGLRVLGERPLRWQALPGGLRLTCDGLVQVTAAGGAAKIRAADGASLPAVEGADEILAWLVAGDQPGLAVLPAADNRGPVTLVRYRGELEIVK